MHITTIYAKYTDAVISSLLTENVVKIRQQNYDVSGEIAEMCVDMSISVACQCHIIKVLLISLFISHVV